MSAEVFLDTNILIYLFDQTDARKNQRAEEVVRRTLETGGGCISHQVVQETRNKFTPVTASRACRPATEPPA